MKKNSNSKPKKKEVKIKFKGPGWCDKCQAPVRYEYDHDVWRCVICEGPTEEQHQRYRGVSHLISLEHTYVSPQRNRI